MKICRHRKNDRTIFYINGNDAIGGAELHWCRNCGSIKLNIDAQTFKADNWARPLVYGELGEV